MELFISTYAKILTSLNGVRNLLEHMDRYSQALKARASILDTSNAANIKLSEISKQTKIIEASMINLNEVIAQDKKNNANTSKKSSGSDSKISKESNALLTECKNSLSILNQSKKTIEATSTEIKQNQDEVDKLLQQYNKELETIRETYFNELAEEMQQKLMKLTDIEKDNLRKNISSTTTIEEKLQNLEKIGIKVPSNMSDFGVVTYDIIVSVLSRNLQEINNTKINDIAKELPVIKAESEAATKLQQNQKNQYDAITTSVSKLKDKINNITIPSTEVIQKQELEVSKIKSDLIAKEQAQKSSSAGG